LLRKIETCLLHLSKCKNVFKILMTSIETPTKQIISLATVFNWNILCLLIDEGRSNSLLRVSEEYVLRPIKRHTSISAETSSNEDHSKHLHSVARLCDMNILCILIDNLSGTSSDPSTEASILRPIRKHRDQLLGRTSSEIHQYIHTLWIESYSRGYPDSMQTLGQRAS
jgi:hypothetical protein